MLKIIFNISIILILILVIYKNTQENLTVYKPYIHKPNAFNTYIEPEECDPKNNCFPGTYNRTEVYNNMCPPKTGGLNRQPVQINDDCVKKL